MSQGLSRRRPQRVSLIVTATETGVAGHHYSVRDLSRALQESGFEVRVWVLRFADKHWSQALEGHGVSQMDAADPLSGRHRLLERNDAAVFCFDESAVRAAIAFMPERLERIVPVKPGWVNSDAWTRFASAFVLFTQENYEFYRDNPRYRGVRPYYMPNRVAPPKTDPALVRRLQDKLGDPPPGERLVFVAGRIDPYKLPTIEQGAALFEALRKAASARLVIIGSASNAEVLKDLQARYAGRSDVSIVTDPAITSRLSSVLARGDLIVANGRTAMEAMLLGKNVAVPTSAGELAELVTPANFDAMLHHNFTQRAAGQAGQGGAAALLGDPAALDRNAEAVREIAEERISTVRAAELYGQVVDFVAVAQARPLDKVAAFLASAARLFFIIVRARLTRPVAKRAQPAGRRAEA